jgi:hypothetical protein
MACLDCGRALTFGAACPCIDEGNFDSAEDETAFWRDQNLWSTRDLKTGSA